MPQIITDIGYSGSREGYQGEQGRTMFTWLQYLRQKFKHIVGHHGDCKGGDLDFHKQCRAMGIPRTIHPPAADILRAFADRTDKDLSKNNWTKVLPVKPYLDRNDDIAEMTSILVATPYNEGEDNSGTWSTIRRALDKRKWVIIIHRDSWEDRGPRPAWCGIPDGRFTPDNIGHLWDGDYCVQCGFDVTDAQAFGSEPWPSCDQWKAEPGVMP